MNTTIPFALVKSTRFTTNYDSKMFFYKFLILDEDLQWFISCSYYSYCCFLLPSCLLLGYNSVPIDYNQYCNQNPNFLAVVLVLVPAPILVDPSFHILDSLLLVDNSIAKK